MIVSSFMFSACSGSSDVTATTFQLNADGTVTHTVIDTASVDESSLRSYIDDALAAYNTDEENPAVELDSLSVKSDTPEVRIVMEYDSVSDYAAFNQVSAFSGTLSEALKAGYGFDGLFTTSTGLTVSGYTLPAEYADLNVLILNEPLNVVIKDHDILCTGAATVDENGNYSIEADFDTTLPEVFQTTNSGYSYFVYQSEEK